MKILIEGPDGTGKTTLAKELCKCKPFFYTHSGRVDNVEKEFEKTYKILCEKEDVIMDRGLLSNTVYSDIFKDTPYVSDGLRKKIIDKIDLVILALPADKNKYLQFYGELMNNRDELYDEMSDIYDGYDSLILYKDYLDKGCDIIIYDILDHDISKVKNIAKEIIKKKC